MPLRTAFKMPSAPCAWLALRSAPLMELVYGGAYRDAALFQSLLVVRHGLLGVLVMTFCAVLIALGEPRRAAVLVLQLVPLGAVLSVVLIQARGAMIMDEKTASAEVVRTA